MSDAGNKTTKAIDIPATEHRVESEPVPLAQDSDLGFHPIKIKGEPLSETIIRDRR